MAKKSISTSDRLLIGLVWDLYTLRKSQAAIGVQLGVRQADVSRCIKVRKVCGEAFVDRLPTEIKIDQLVRLADECKREKLLDSKPATEFVKAVASGSITYSGDKLNAVAPKLRKFWWEVCDLTSLALNLTLQAMHPEFAKILADSRNHPNFSALLTAHPPTKTKIKKS